MPQRVTRKCLITQNFSYISLFNYDNTACYATIWAITINFHLSVNLRYGSHYTVYVYDVRMQESSFSFSFVSIRVNGKNM